jgi:hypothetical protein
VGGSAHRLFAKHPALLCEFLKVERDCSKVYGRRTRGTQENEEWGDGVRGFVEMDAS